MDRSDKDVEQDVQVFRTRFIPSLQFFLFVAGLGLIFFMFSKITNIVTIFLETPPEDRWWEWPLYIFGIGSICLWTVYCYVIGNVEITLSPTGLTMQRLDVTVSCRWEDIRKIEHSTMDAFTYTLVKTTKGKIYIPENVLGRHELLSLIEERFAAVQAERRKKSC